MTSPGHPRLCTQCGVHPNLCVCDQCEQMTDAPPIWLLQDPGEVGHAKGTARIADACLPALTRLVGKYPEDFTELASDARVGHMGVLFPTPQSRPLESSDVASISGWIVLDGTWRKARRLFLSNPWLASLPQFHFQDPPSSGYTIRKRPNRQSLATAEAIICLLRQVAPRCDVTPLEQAMAALLERQLRQIPASLHRRYPSSPT